MGLMGARAKQDTSTITYCEPIKFSDVGLESQEGVCQVVNLEHVPEGWFKPIDAEIGPNEHMYVVYRGTERIFVIRSANGSVREMPADTTRIRFKNSINPCPVTV